MTSSRELTLTLCLLAVHASAGAQEPSPGAGAFTFLGRTPDAGLSEVTLVATDGQDTCRDYSMYRQLEYYAQINWILCFLPLASRTDNLRVEAFASVGDPHAPLTGRYWLTSSMSALLVAYSRRSDLRVLTAYSGYASAWATDGIMFRAHDTIRVDAERVSSTVLDPRARLWLDRCDAKGCLLFRELREKFPWSITLPANRPPEFPRANPEPGWIDLESEYYRISMTLAVEVTGTASDFMFNSNGVFANAAVSLRIGISSAGCVPDTAGC